MKRREIITLESLGKQHSGGRRFRVHLVAHPGVFDGVFFFQLVDNALADVTEGSDIIGKYFEVDHPFIPRLFIII
jgi:hypothetical protein